MDPFRVGTSVPPDFDGYWSAPRGQYRVVDSIDEGQVSLPVVRVLQRGDDFRGSTTLIRDARSCVRVCRVAPRQFLTPVILQVKSPGSPAAGAVEALVIPA